MSRKIKHVVSYESLVAWGCICGATWMNEFLKGKSDDELLAERDRAYKRHLLKNGVQNPEEGGVA